MYKKNKSMDFCRSGKTMMDYARTPKPSKDRTMMDAKANLLKAVPNREAYEKLSDIEKADFNKAAKKAGLPMKPAATEGQDNPKYRGNEDEID